MTHAVAAGCWSLGNYALIVRSPLPPVTPFPPTVKMKQPNKTAWPRCLFLHWGSFESLVSPGLRNMQPHILCCERFWDYEDFEVPHISNRLHRETAGDRQTAEYWDGKYLKFAQNEKKKQPPQLLELCQLNLEKNKNKEKQHWKRTRGPTTLCLHSDVNISF